MKFAIWQSIQDMINPPGLTALVAEELAKTQQELANAEHVILSHRFQRHMALAKIAALEDWHHGRERESAESQTLSPVRCVPQEGGSK